MVTNDAAFTSGRTREWATTPRAELDGRTPVTAIADEQSRLAERLREAGATEPTVP